MSLSKFRKPDFSEKNEQDREKETKKAKTAGDLGLHKFPPDKTVTLNPPCSGDDPAYANRGRCDGELDIFPGEAFSYHKDYMLFKHRVEMEIMTFIGKQIILLTPDQNEIPMAVVNAHIESGLDYHMILENRFGSLDRNCDQYKNLLEALKISVKEEYLEWVESSNEILQAHPFPAMQRDDQLYQVASALVAPGWKFLPDTPTSTALDPPPTQSPNVFKSRKEPYDLPRPNPKDLITEILLESNDGSSATSATSPTSTSKSTSGCTLATGRTLAKGEFDCLAYFEPSSFIENPQDRKNKHLQNLVKICLRYPLGLTPARLWKVYQREFEEGGNKRGQLDFPNLTLLGYSNIEELLILRDDLFTIMTGTDDSYVKKLVFPSSREKIVSINVILRRLHHHILLILKYLNAQNERRSQVPRKTHETTATISIVKMKLKDLSKYLTNFFGIRFSLEDWGVDSTNPLPFYESLLHKYDGGRMEIVSDRNEKLRHLIHFLKLTPAGFKEKTDETKMNVLESLQEEYGYSMRDKLASKTFVPGANEMSVHPAFSRPIYPPLSDFAPISTKIPSVGDYWRVGERYFCRPDFMLSPLQFNVSLLQGLYERDAFIVWMTSEYSKWMKNPSFASASVLLEDIRVKSSYVAVLFEDEWVRGQIIGRRKTKTKEFFELYLIDLGFYMKKVTVNDMKMLHKDFVDYPAQMVSCRLDLGKIEKTYGLSQDSTADEFPKNILDVFYETLTFQIIGIIPLKKVAKAVDWEVKCFIQDSVKTSILPDLLEGLMTLDLTEDEKREQESKSGASVGVGW